MGLSFGLKYIYKVIVYLLSNINKFMEKCFLKNSLIYGRHLQQIHKHSYMF